MALSTVQDNNRLVRYVKQFQVEWARDNLFSPYQGTGMNAIIQVIEDLSSGGNEINIPHLSQLRGAGVGSGTLTGNEERMDDYGQRGWIDWARHAIVMKKSERHKQSADAFAQAKPRLNEWADLLRRDETIEALMALPSTSQPVGLDSDAGDRVNGLRYGGATTTAANRNTWNANNSDRVVYGNSLSNYNATHATALANIDTTDDLFGLESAKLMRRVGRVADPAIKPFKVSGGKEWFVFFHGPSTFADFQAALDAAGIDKDGRAREGNAMDKNPLFQSGDEQYRGGIHVEIPEIDAYAATNWPTLTTAGAASTRVYPVFMCGQAALAMLVGQRPQATFDKADDYGFLKNAGIEMAYGITKKWKLFPKESTRLVQTGVVTGFFAASST